MQVAEQFRRLPEIKRRRIEMPPHTMRLNRLERPEPWSHELWARAALSMTHVDWYLYPDYLKFYRRLAEFVEVSEREIVVGAGIEEFIRSFMMLHQGRRVAVLWPTCLMFEIYARAFGVELVKIPTPCSIEDVARNVSVDAILLVNPGQPFETCFQPEEIQWLCRAFPDAWIAVDEAYHGFGAPTVLGDHRVYPNLMVLRTFSKAFGAAGIRLGYAVGARRTLDYLDAVRPSGEVSGLSMAVATVLMDNPEAVEAGVAEVMAGREWLRARFAEVGYVVRGEWGNHVLVETTQAVKIVHDLQEIGVLVRLVDEQHFMVTCGSVDTMRRFWIAFGRPWEFAS